MSEHRLLGRTGLAISPFCLGTAMLGGTRNPDRTYCISLVHAALDLGINLIDTADIYNGGESEEIVGEAIAGRRDSVFIATKVGTVLNRFPRVGGTSRPWIMRAVEASLRRLRIETIDLLQIHQRDDDTAAEETLGALDRLVQQGKVHYVGHSNLRGFDIADIEWRSRIRSGISYTTHQPAYNLMMRRAELEILPACRLYQLGVLAYGCLNAGWLTGRYRRGAAVAPGSRGSDPGSAPRFDLSIPGNARKLDVVEELDRLAGEAGVSLTHLALAWVLHNPDVSGLVLGPRTIEQLQNLVAARDVLLDTGTLQRIDEIVPPNTDVNPLEADIGRAPGLAAATATPTATSHR